MAGLFKKNGRARRIPEKLAQYDDEYLLYCVETRIHSHVSGMSNGTSSAILTGSASPTFS